MRIPSIIKMLIATTLVASAFSFFPGGKEKQRFKGYKKEKSGTYFLQHVKGKGTTTVDTGGAIFVKIKFKTEADSVFLDVNEAAQTPSFPLRIDKPAFDGDFLDVIMRLHVGDSVSFFINFDTLTKYYPEDFNFGQRFGSSQLDSMNYLGFSVKVDSIYTRSKVEEIRAQVEAENAKNLAEAEKLKEQEPAKIEAYLKDHNITTAPTASGIYYIETWSGTGDTIRPGQVVSFHYTGKYLDGEIFDSSAKTGQPIGFTTGQGQMIPGIEEAIQLMKKGTKATVIIPSSQGYGSGGGMMKPYATLVFDIEIVDVQ